LQTKDARHKLQEAKQIPNPTTKIFYLESFYLILL